MRQSCAVIALAALLLSGCVSDVGDTPDAFNAAPTPEQGRSQASHPPDTDPLKERGMRPQEGSAAAAQRQVVWVALEGAGKVAKVDVASRRVLRRFEVPGAPHNLTVGIEGAVAVTLQDVGDVAILRRGRMRVVSLGGSPHDVKVVGGLAVITNEDSARLDLVSVRTGRVRAPILLETDPHDLAISPSGRIAWVTLNGTDEIAIVNLERKEVSRYLATGVSPHDVLFAPNGRRIWVTDWNGSVHVFSRNGTLVKSINRGVELHHLVFTRDGREAWVSDGGADRVFVISAWSLRVLTAKQVGGSPHHLALTSNGRMVAVANNDEGTLALFDVVTYQPRGAIRVGQRPHGAWVGR